MCCVTIYIHVFKCVCNAMGAHAYAALCVVTSVAPCRLGLDECLPGQRGRGRGWVRAGPCGPFLRWCAPLHHFGPQAGVHGKHCIPYKYTLQICCQVFFYVSGNVLIVRPGVYLASWLALCIGVGLGVCLGMNPRSMPWGVPWGIPGVIA